MRAAISAALPAMERHGATSWDFGDLPRQVERGEVRGYPALVDEGGTVGVAVLETRAAQAASMWRGTRRLLLLAAPLPDAHLQRRMTNDAKLAIARSGTPLSGLLADCATAVADQIIVAHGGPAFDAVGFEALAAEARAGLVERVARVATIAGSVLGAAEQVRERVVRLEHDDRAGILRPALADVRRQLRDLVYAGFVTSFGTARFRDLLRYLQAALRRLERLPADARRDAERQARIDRLRARYERLAAQVAGGSASPSFRAALSEVPWMIEELRVSLWAQDLGTPEPVSEERIMRAIDRLNDG
jgi:ATP-dependent helicase HrpA